MLKSRLRITSCFLWVMLTLLGFYPSSPAKAETLTTYGASDFYFQLEAGTTFTVRSTAQVYGIDSMLWLYNSNNTVLTANDDYYGLDSYISYNVQESGTYRLRTGVCCGNPDAWRGTSYTIQTNAVPSATPPQPTTTTTVPPTTTTTLPPLGMRTPTNLVAQAYDGRVTLSWDAPEGGVDYAEVERYAVFFTSNNWETSFAIASTTTSATVYNLENGTTYQFRVRADNDTLHVYSSMIETYTVSATPVTTTTTTIRPTTTTSTTTSSLPVPPVESSSTVVVTTSSSTSTTTTVARTTTTLRTPTTSVVAPSTTLLAPTTTLPESTTSSTSSTTIAPQNDPQEIVDTEVTALLGAIADLPQSEVQAAVDNIIEKGVSAAEAEELATNPDVIQSVTPEQAAEIFDAVEVSDLSEAQAEQLVEAVQGASEEVRAEFEDQINVFGGKFNKYVPIGSNINVGQRRVLVAASGVLFMAPAVPVSSSSSSTQSDSSKRRK